jgi:hypothetical protein
MIAMMPACSRGWRHAGHCIADLGDLCQHQGGCFAVRLYAPPSVSKDEESGELLTSSRQVSRRHQCKCCANAMEFP